MLHRSDYSSWDDEVPSNVMKEMKKALDEANKRERVSCLKKKANKVIKKIVPVSIKKRRISNQVAVRQFT